MTNISDMLTGESTTVEYKEKVSEGFFESISAFANTEGGTIYLGIKDGSQEVVGINLSNGKQESIINQIVDNTKVQPNIDILNEQAKSVLKISIAKAEFPVAYKGIFYKRIGNSTRKMTADEQKCLLLRDVSWDNIVNDNYKLTDIDVNTVSKFVNLAISKTRLPNEARTYNVEELLENLGLMIDGKLTNGAILLFGLNPQKWFKNASIRVGLFKGNDEENILDDKLIAGNLFNQIYETDILLKSLIKVRYLIKGLNREEVWEYPIVAIREALLNALIHRDYFDYSSNIQIKIFDDYIWFYNSGALFGGLTIEQLKNANHPSKTRNPNITNTIFKAGYIESFGTGIKRMIKACQRQGLPIPEMESNDTGFILKIAKQYTRLNDRQKKAMDYILENGYITNSIYQELNSTTRETSKRDLKKMVDFNILSTHKSGRSVEYLFKLI